MALEQTLTDTLTQAIKARDTQTADVVRMLKTKVQERRTAKGFAGAVDDALVLDVISAYRKLLQKALAEYEKVGERGAGQAAQLRFEIEFCERYLPETMDDAAVRALVRERIGGRRWLHAAQSHFHDVTPARRHGIPTAWINRKHQVRGEPRPDRELHTLTELADWLA